MLCRDGKERFPRLRFPRRIEDYPRFALGAMKCSKRQRYRAMILNGTPPKRWHRLTRRQKLVARQVASGMRVADVCKRIGMSDNTFYHWLHCHPLFQKYYFNCATKYAEKIDRVLDAKLPRAARVVENALQSGDPYFAHDAAIQLLKGRGKYKNLSQQQGKVSHSFEGSVEINENVKIKDDKTIVLLVDAMNKLAAGEPSGKVKTIDVEVLKALPPAQQVYDEIQAGEKHKREAVAKN